MKKRLYQYVFLGIGLTYFASCSFVGENVIAHSEYHASLIEENLEDKAEQYHELVGRISIHQDKFKNEFSKVDAAHQQGLIALAKNYIHVTLSDSIWSHWYGTLWDFNGTTESPGDGYIACGYFVSTTLRHVGYNVDRVALAQQAASVIITTMCGKGKTKVIGNNDKEALEDYMLSQKDGIYICGLDSHVGFIEKKGELVYFVHSSGLYSQLKVVKEELKYSAAIGFSQAYYVGDLLANTSNLEKWIKKEKITVEK